VQSIPGSTTDYHERNPRGSRHLPWPVEKVCSIEEMACPPDGRHAAATGPRTGTTRPIAESPPGWLLAQGFFSRADRNEADAKRRRTHRRRSASGRIDYGTSDLVIISARRGSQQRVRASSNLATSTSPTAILLAIHLIESRRKCWCSISARLAASGAHLPSSVSAGVVERTMGAAALRANLWIARLFDPLVPEIGGHSGCDPRKCAPGRMHATFRRLLHQLPPACAALIPGSRRRCRAGRTPYALAEQRAGAGRRYMACRSSRRISAKGKSNPP